MAGRFDKIAFAFNGSKVYDALFIKEKVPTYFMGCSATILKVIEKKNIPVDKFRFASYSVKTGYKECSADYKSRRLLINAEWVEANVPGFGMATPAPSAAPQKTAHKPAAEEPTNTKSYPPAPPMLELEDSEMFVDDSGKVIEIEVRGERHFDKIWFKARDVETMLLLSDIGPVMQDVKSSFEEGVHYQTFDLIPLLRNSGHHDQKKNKNELALFLSYWGLVKMLFGRRHPVAIKFQRWAIEKLFVIQMGTPEAKEGMAADVLGVTPQTLKAVLSTNANSMPVIYLFQLGTVKELRSSFPDEIPETFKDSDIVFKYGLTTDFKQRTIQHEASFKKFSYADGEPVNIQLKYHVYIDPVHLSDAEMDIERYFKSAKWHLNIKQKKLTEVVAVPETFVSNIIHNEFKRLGNTYAGRLQDMQTQLRNEQKINEQLKVQIDSQEKYHQEAMKTQEKFHDDVVRAHEQLIMEKDLRLKEKDEMLQMKNEMLQTYKEMLRMK
jgi:hypothetical protein